MPISSKEQDIQAGRKAVEEDRKAVGNINTHEGYSCTETCLY
ncbi:hypothetical protein ACFFHM_15455 [Halalkalibacter kiskunsagensis]|uniref:Uncharacterized protein n=1 Tax=Halalkalibacter kiskunsagensis TaxID=1548599 RepID=A0ABV6KEV7_9BACI